MMRKIFLLLILFPLFLYKAQERILPLDSTIKDSIKLGDYLKDLHNDYIPFIGTWKAAFDDKIILIKIIKVSKRPARIGFREKEVNYFEDTLILQHKITDKNGKVIENYLHPNPNISKIISQGFNKKRKIAYFFYSGVACSVGLGGIDLEIINSKHMLWNYFPQETFTNRCPKGTDITIYLPETKDLIFTKQ